MHAVFMLFVGCCNGRQCQCWLARGCVRSSRQDVQVCDHAKWASALGLQRVIHKIEINEQQGTECAQVPRAWMLFLSHTV